MPDLSTAVEQLHRHREMLETVDPMQLPELLEFIALDEAIVRELETTDVN